MEDGSTSFLPLSEIELQEWMTIDSFDPIGPERADLNAARIVQALCPSLDLEEATLHFDVEAWEERKRERLRAAFMNKGR